MNTVMITRSFSGFNNVADRLLVGNFEADGNASVSEYFLPEGYSVASGNIYDTAGIMCEPVLENGQVTLISRLGTCEDVILREVA